MPKSIVKIFPKITLTIIFCGLLFQNLIAQGEIIAKLNFDPRVNGFAFKNYGNVGDRWKDDLGAEDLIRMFGVNAVCKNKSAKNCQMDATARRWLEEKLEAMKIGHCEGIAAISLRMNSGLAFKNRKTPSSFQSGVNSPFNLRLEQNLENYIAYYWLTQTFKEVKAETAKTIAGQRGPLDIVKTLIDAMNSGRDTYLLRLWKYEEKKPFEDGHSLTPYAIENAGNRYKVHVYDNNYPGETRFLYVTKDGNQNWTYASKSNAPNAKPDYFGNIATKSLQMTATSWRDNRCFDATFARDEEVATGCGIETASLNQPFFRNASFQSQTDEDGEHAEFFLTGEGNMLVIENGRRLGYDPNNQFYNQIPGGSYNLLVGGLDVDTPLYYVPYQDTGGSYTIVFSGKNLEEEEESIFDFVFSAPGFVVGFDSIRLDSGETLTATISHDGEEITFKTSAEDGETPEVFYAFDADDDSGASYITTIEGVELSPETELTYNFDFENLKLYFSDNDGEEDEYDIELIRLNADGTEQVYVQNDLNIGQSDQYEMDFGDWDGEGEMCFKDDDDGDGFGDEECEEQANEEPDN